MGCTTNPTNLVKIDSDTISYEEKTMKNFNKRRTEYYFTCTERVHKQSLYIEIL